MIFLFSILLHFVLTEKVHTGAIMLRAATSLLSLVIVTAAFQSSAENYVKVSQETVYAYATEKSKLVSPIVLSFKSDQSLQTVELLKSNVKFDLDADGSKERTGWINPEDGFLFVDLNRNGVVDSGKELFGEKSGFGPKEYNNGYEALKVFDTNNSGFVDAEDQYFKLIKVWFDHNSNGISEKSEIRTLNDLQITSFEVQPTSYQSKTGMGNYIPLTAKFWGPEMCGDQGCHSYDVFFLTVH